MGSGEKPGAIVCRRECKRSRSDQLDFVTFILKLLAFRVRIFFQELRPPFADYSLRLGDAPLETEAAHNFWVVIVDRCERDKSILRIKLLDFPQRLRGPVSF